MTAETILGVMAQLALIIVGFSGIVSVLGRRVDGHWSEADIARTRVMIAASFRVLFLALLPFVFLHFNLADNIVWRWCSGIAAISGATQLAIHFRMARRVAPDPGHNKYMQHLLVMLAVVIFLIHTANAVGIGLGPAFGPYLLALMLSFVIPCLLFIRLLQTAFQQSP